MLTRKDIEDALDYMDRHGLIRLSRSRNFNSNWIQLHCPFHSNGQEKRPSCGCSLTEDVAGGVTYSPGNFHCFACGASYSFGKGVKEILKIKETSLEAHPDLAPYVNNVDDIPTESLIPDGLMSSLLTSYAIENLKMRSKNQVQYVAEEELVNYRFTVPYMYQRKLTDPIIEKYDVGFDGNYKAFGRSDPVPCITFPVRDIQGRTLFICRRSIEGKFFFMPPEIEKPVYGIYELPKNAKEVIICESIFNALTSVVYGHPAVALFGTGTPYQINQLKRLGVQSYVICLDNDPAGLRGSKKLKKELSGSAMVWTMTVPEDKDVNDLMYNEFVEVYNNRE